MSSYKALIQGEDHKRVPDNVAENPTIIGHEFSGELIEVGTKWAHKFKAGQKFTVQPALNYKGSLAAPGYSYPHIGGDATYVIIPNEVMEMDCLLTFESDSYFGAALAEPLSCVAGTYHAMYHTSRGSYEHKMGIKSGGKMSILAGAGPMGLAAIDYIIHTDGPRPSLLVVTDIDQARLDRAAEILTKAEAAKHGIDLVYLNTGNVEDPVKQLMELSGNEGYDDVLVFAPVASVIEQGDSILGQDGCLNFFAGPSDPNFRAKFNSTMCIMQAQYSCTSGGNTDDMREVLDMISEEKLNPLSLLRTLRIGCGNRDNEESSKPARFQKLIYTHISPASTAISDFEEKGKTDTLFAGLAEIVAANNGMWSPEAEKYLLENAKPI